MGLAAIFGLSLWVALSGALMPGPVLTVSVARVAARGFLAAPRIVLGHALLEVGVVAGLFWGLNRVLQQNAVRGTIGLVGGAMLLWMGISVIAAVRAGKVRLDLQAGSPLAEGGAGRDVTLGVVASVSNPYWLAWWATVGAAMALRFLGERGIPGLASFTLGHVSGDLLWYTLVGGIVATQRRAINERIYQGFLVVCSLFLIWLAVWFGWSGVQWLAGG